MKYKEKEAAIRLRKNGYGLGYISQELHVAKSTVSYWVRDVQLSTIQKNVLKQNSHSRYSIELRRESRMKRHANEREIISEEAYKEADSLKFDHLWCVAVALYWGEGGKTQRTVRIANSDPDVIKLMMKFFLNTCRVPLDKIRGHIHTFSDADVTETESYWSQVSGIPKNQFFKTYIKNSIATKNKRQTLPWGTIQIYVHDSVLFVKMMAWIDYLKKLENYHA